MKNNRTEELKNSLLDLFEVNEAEEEKIVNVPLKDILSNPFQPRKEFDEDKLRELADSIREHGVFQPVLLCQKDEKYILIAGERRVKASLMAGMEDIPAIIREYNEKLLIEIGLLENLQRENLNGIEIASSLQQMSDMLGYNQEEIAEHIGKSREYVTNTLRLLQLPDNIQKEVIAGRLSAGHARALLSIKDDDIKEDTAEKIIKEKLSVRATEELVKKRTDKEKSQEEMRIREMEVHLRKYFQLDDVKIMKKKVVIPFEDIDELIYVIDRIIN